MAKKKTTTQNIMGLVKNDPYLEPYNDAIRGRHEHALWKIKQLTDKHWPKLQAGTNITVCTAPEMAGPSANGHHRQPTYIW